MQKVLNKRLIRELKDNFLRYLALFSLILLGMYLVISIVGSAESIIIRVHEAAEKNKVEDGEFTVFVPLEEETLRELENKGITLEEEFYLDYILSDNSTLRIYKNRKYINQIELDEGRLAEKDDEIVLEKHFAQKHKLILGSSITITGKKYKVTGIGTVPDYDAPLNRMSDVSVESNIFGLGFVTDGCYTRLKAEGKASKSEEYIYSYLLNGTMSSDELKEYICSLRFDKSKVKDTYFLKMLEETEKTKHDLEKGVNEILTGTKQLNKGLVLCVAGHTVKELDEVGLKDSMEKVMLGDRMYDRVKSKEISYWAACPGRWKQGKQTGISICARPMRQGGIFKLVFVVF
jgi:putative ABC transport system permease protein